MFMYPGAADILSKIAACTCTSLDTYGYYLFLLTSKVYGITAIL